WNGDADDARSPAGVRPVELEHLSEPQMPTSREAALDEDLVVGGDVVACRERISARTTAADAFNDAVYEVSARLDPDAVRFAPVRSRTNVRERTDPRDYDRERLPRETRRGGRHLWARSR